MRSFNHVNAFNKNDTIVQMARCSFDAHVEEIIGALIIGATVIMLRPRGNLDFAYLTRVLGIKQITCMDSVPSVLQRFLTFVEEHNRQSAIKYLRCLLSGGAYSFERIISVL